MTTKSFIKTIGAKGLLADYNTEGKKLQTHLTFDASPTAGSNNPVTSGGIKTALNNYVEIYKGDSSNFHVKNNEYYSFICRTNISNWARIQADFFCASSDSSTVGKFNIFATLSTTDTSLHTPERVAELGGIVWDYNYKGYNSIKYKIYVAKSGDNFYFYAKRSSSNDKLVTAFRSCLLYTTNSGLTDNVSADLDDATWQTLSLVEMKNVYSSTTQERLDSHTSDTTVHITADERTAWNAKQSSLTFDDTPTAGSTNPVTSDGIASINGYKKLFAQGNVSSTLSDSSILFYIKWKSPTDSGIYNRQYEINYSNFRTGASGTIKIAPNITNPTGGAINLVSDRFNFNDISFGVIEAPDGDSTHPYWFVGYGYGVGGSIEINQNGRNLTYTDRPVVVPKEQVLISSCNFTKVYEEKPKYYTNTLYPPTTGTFILKSINGVIQWVSE